MTRIAPFFCIGETMYLNLALLLNRESVTAYGIVHGPTWRISFGIFVLISQHNWWKQIGIEKISQEWYKET
jgi:hypothetical protein